MCIWTEIQLFAQIVRVKKSETTGSNSSTSTNDNISLCVLIYWVHIVSGNIDHFKQSVW